VLKSISRILLSGFGLGYIPKAPGTWGSLGAIGFLVLINIYELSFGSIFITYLLLSIVFGQYYLKATNTKDPQWIVADEILGVFIIFTVIPFQWETALAGFVLFRFFDIVKPLGIRACERAEGIIGVLLDDLVAGLYSLIIIYIVLLFI